MKQRVLLVEDDVALQYMYRLKLESEKFDVKTAGDGLEGLKLAEEFAPHLMLVDIKMPHMCGDEMLEKIRETNWGAHIRVVILTNLSKNEAPTSLRFLNIDRYAIKAHTTPSQVITIIRDVLK